MAGLTDRITSLVRDAVEQQGVILWDVRFVKEGASHYLRIFIDRDEGITIDDCTNVSHAVDPILDEADPIDCAYYLEVCSPGIERELSRDMHFEYAVGKRVRIRLFKAIDGKKEFEGTLTAFDGTLTIEADDTVNKFERAAVSKAVLADFDE